ncbi:MAG: DNA helicase RecQ [Bacteroidetes bacterium]|nr:DNA helicase RecQ [Bacteroidota bacterium]MBT4411762.1 DNA helicase RecQ [Bacteroidota bacterium]MBT7463382.1 DNA helicase RecQ [Bacteroidota bacterium]
MSALLQQYFGYNSFRTHQKEIIQRTLKGEDSVVLMPTGGGKSLCYQLPAVVLDGLTVVVSPLIALMKDQVQSLVANGIAAAYLNSSLTSSQEAKLITRLQSNSYKLLYVAPERLFARGFLSFLSQLRIGLFAIDEAHCISTWGHHFRPDYKRLSILKKQFPGTPFMALTATADKAVRRDIGDLLLLKNHKYYISSFDRPNLSLAVLPGQKKWEQLFQIVQKYPEESGIIYCGSRATTEKLADKLRNAGKKAVCYHAGLNPSIRSKTQDQFIQGDVDIVCATIAFGMGIDKANIRFVVHYNMPGNLESLYQEIGRAGRDGQAAETVLFYSYRDVQTHLGFMEDVDDSGYRSILAAKLKRMQEYAEAQVCRRKILLSYFSESPGPDCGNCDVCKNPPEYFDGSIEAKKAISAIARSQEKLSVSVLIEVLKGQYSQKVKDKNWQILKTFGAGREHSLFAWQLYLQQMIQQGIMEIDYRDHNNLKLTTVSERVLKGESVVNLVKFETIKIRQEEQKKKAKLKIKIDLPDDLKLPIDPKLFEALKELRKEIAMEIRKPAFVVFSDASLEEMAANKPLNQEQFLKINGVGKYKSNRYAKEFLDLIQKFL